MLLLSSISNLTKKEVFLKVKEHLLLQNKQSWLPDHSGCAYLGEGGLKCAVGCLMTEEELNSLTDEDQIKEIHALIDLGKMDKTHQALLSRLQEIHDMVLPSSWGEALDRFEKYQLDQV